MCMVYAEKIGKICVNIEISRCQKIIHKLRKVDVIFQSREYNCSNARLKLVQF